MVKQITLRWLRKHNACEDGIEAFKRKKNHGTIETLRRNAGEDWGEWLLEKILPEKLKEEWEKECRGWLHDSFRGLDLKYIRIIEKKYFKKENKHGKRFRNK